MAADDTRPAFRFENYEGFLGFGASDAAAAKRDFLQAFPSGTSLDTIDAYFKKIEGRCFEMPRDWPGRMICHYEHPKFWLLPFLPIRSGGQITDRLLNPKGFGPNDYDFFFKNCQDYCSTLRKGLSQGQ